MSDPISGSTCSTSKDRKRHISEETPSASSKSKQRKPIENETTPEGCSTTNEQTTLVSLTPTSSLNVTGHLLTKQLCGAQIGVPEPLQEIVITPTMEDGSQHTQITERETDTGFRSPENEQSREILSTPYISATVGPVSSDSVQTKETIAGQSIRVSLGDIHSAQGLVTKQNYNMGQIRATSRLTSWGSLDNANHKQSAPQAVNYMFHPLLTAGTPLYEYPCSIVAPTILKSAVAANALPNQNNCLIGTPTSEMFTKVVPDLADARSVLSTVSGSSVLKPSGDKSFIPVSQNTRDNRNMCRVTDIAGPSSWEPSLDFHMFPETFLTGEVKARSTTERLSLYGDSVSHKAPSRTPLRDDQPSTRMPIISESPPFDTPHNIDTMPVTQTLYQRSAALRLQTLEDLGTSLQEDLINYYWTNEMRITVSPLVEEHSVPLVNFYVTPPMKAYVKPVPFSVSKHTSKQKPADSTKKDPGTIQIGSYHDLFKDRDNTRFKNVYISAPAGMGKTSFSQSLTITWCQAHRTDQSVSDKFTKVNLETMRYFDLLFLIHLRDYQDSNMCCADDMISDMLSKCMAIKDKYSNQLIQYLLEEKRCLVVLDGLDEWTHPATCPRKPLVPHNNHTKLCTTVTTTRPWKLSIVGLAANNIDRHVEICLLDWETSKELEVNAVNILNENNAISEPKDRGFFDEIVRSVGIGEIRHIPYVKLQLICLWYDGEPIGKSRCEIYINVIELTLKRGLRKPGLPIISTPEAARDAIPKCMKNNELCGDYINLLLKTGELAFFSLFNAAKESSLIIKSKTVLKYMNVKELDFCLKIGLLSQSKDSGRVSDIYHNISFQHKSIQEFFSALFVTAESCKELTRITIMNMCRSLREVLEMSNVFIFVCGMKPDVYSSIVQQVIERDEISRNYRSGGMNGGDMKIMRSYQDMQIAAFEENLKNESERYPIPLQDIIIDRDIIDLDHAEYFFSQLMSNTNSVKSIYMDGEDLYPGETLFLYDDTVKYFQNLEALTQLNPGIDPKIISDLLTYSCNSLKYLCLGNIDFGRYIYTEYKCTLNTSLHNNVEMIFSSIESCTLLESIQMYSIGCELELHECCGFKLRLSQMSRLNTLDLSHIFLSELGLPEHSQLQKLSLSHIKLSVLDLSECSQLQELSLSDITLTVLDLSACRQLQKLSLSEIELSVLDLSECSKMKELSLNKNINYYRHLSMEILPQNTKSLALFYIADIHYLDVPHDSLHQLFQSIGKGKQLKRVEVKLTQCSDHPDNCPGVPLIFSYQCELESLCLNRIPLRQLDINRCSLLTSLDLVDIRLSHLDLSLNTLQTLSLRKIPLSKLDLTLCTQLQTLSMSAIPLSQLDLKHNSKMEIINLEDIPLSEIFLNTDSLVSCKIYQDKSIHALSHNSLHQLICSIEKSRMLEQLKLKNLKCTDHSENCTGVPMNLSQKHLEVLHLEVIALSILDISPISQLQTLNLQGIPLVALDITQNSQLTSLHLKNLHLRVLDVSRNSCLRKLHLEEIPLSVIDIAYNSHLKDIHLKHLPLSVLHISRNNHLDTIHFEKIPLTELIVETEPPRYVTSSDRFLWTNPYKSIYLTVSEITMTASAFRELFLSVCNSERMSFDITLNKLTMPASEWKELLIDIVPQIKLIDFYIITFTLTLQMCKGPTRQEWENILTEHSLLSDISIFTDSDAASVYASGNVTKFGHVHAILTLAK